MKASQREIVLAAREHFRQRGYAGMSMQDLADTVGLRKASLYSRFSTKETVAEEVLKLTATEALGERDAAAAPLDAYRSALTAFSGGLIASGRCVALHLAYGAGEDEPGLKAAAGSFFADCRARLAAILQPAVGSDEAMQMAADAIAQMEGATLWLVLDNDAEPMRRAVARLVDQAENAIARRSGAPSKSSKPAK